MGLRDRKAERAVFGRGGSAVRYQLRQKMVSIGDDFWVEDGDGRRVYKVDGKAMRLRRTMDLQDVNGRDLVRIQTRVMHIRDSMDIESAEGKQIARVHKALISPLRERWKVDVEDGEDLEVQGNIVDHEYEIEAGGRKVAEVSKKWFRVRDSYGIEADPAMDPVLIISVAIAIDSMSHPGD